jgi:hypothetical protein
MNQPSTSPKAASLRISAILVGLALLMAALAAPVAAVTVPTDPEPNLECPANYGTGLVTEYTTTVETPADSADWFVSVEFSIENDGDTEASCQLSLSTYELPGNELVFPQTVYSQDVGTFGPGTHVLRAELPRQGDVATCFSQYDFVFGPVIDELSAENRYGDRQIRAEIVGSEDCELEGEQPGGDTATVMVMKHNCADVTTMAEFEEVEARAATNPTTPGAAFGATVETVLECPTVVLPGDEQTAGAVAGGESTFDFSVTDADGTAVLSADGMYAASAACETDVMYDADRSGALDAGVCLDLSHYAFEVSTDGQVTVTETAAPAGLVFGALRFTPGSGDDAALVSAANGEIVLDVAADEDGMIMLHVYNFAIAEGEQPGGGGQQPGEAVLGGQGGPASLPDTAVATPARTSSSLVLLALLVVALATVTVGAAPLAVARRR